jgi:hypothetical protein
MTTTLSITGRAIHFPGPLTLGPDGILTAPPRERLVETPPRSTQTIC